MGYPTFNSVSWSQVCERFRRLYLDALFDISFFIFQNEFYNRDTFTPIIEETTATAKVCRF